MKINMETQMAEMKDDIAGLKAALEALARLVEQAASAKSSISALETKTVEIVVSGLLHGDDTTRALWTFSEESFKDYLKSMQCGGLIPLDEAERKVAVCEFAQLVPGGIYTHAHTSKEAFDRVLRETLHLQESQEDEFGRGLTLHLPKAEPEQGYERRDDLRMQLVSGNKIAEHDVVVKGRGKAYMYIGSHKTYAKGAKLVKDIAERCNELAKLPNNLPSILKPAIMVERVEPRAEPRIQNACRILGVMRFQRSGLAIQVVNRTGAARKLLRL